MFNDEKESLTDDPEVTPEPELNPSANSDADALKAEADEWKNKYLRQLAEFDNFRKRSKQEMATVRDYVSESLIVSLLPVVDDFNRMLENLATDDATRKGIVLVHEKLKTFLESHGVRLMDARGLPFDESRHDALVMTPTADFPAGTVMEVLTPGYLMGDRVIRHAQVVVSCEPEAAE